MRHPAPASTKGQVYKTFLDFCSALRAELIARLGEGAVNDALVTHLADPANAKFFVDLVPTPTALWNGLISFLLAGGVPVEQLKGMSFGEAPSPAALADSVIGEVVHAARLPVHEITRDAAPHKPRVQRLVQAAYEQLVGECVKFVALEFHNRPTPDQERTGDEMPEIAFGPLEQCIAQLGACVAMMTCPEHRRICGSSFARVPKEHRVYARGA